MNRILFRGVASFLICGLILDGLQAANPEFSDAFRPAPMITPIPVQMSTEALGLASTMSTMMHRLHQALIGALYQGGIVQPGRQTRTAVRLAEAYAFVGPLKSGDIKEIERQVREGSPPIRVLVGSDAPILLTSENIALTLTVLRAAKQVDIHRDDINGPIRSVVIPRLGDQRVPSATPAATESFSRPASGKGEGLPPDSIEDPLAAFWPAQCGPYAAVMYGEFVVTGDYRSAPIAITMMAAGGVVVSIYDPFSHVGVLAHFEDDLAFVEVSVGRVLSAFEAAPADLSRLDIKLLRDPHWTDAQASERHPPVFEVVERTLRRELTQRRAQFTMNTYFEDDQATLALHTKDGSVYRLTPEECGAHTPANTAMANAIMGQIIRTARRRLQGADNGAIMQRPSPPEKTAPPVEDNAGQIFRGDPRQIYEALVSRPEPLRDLRAGISRENILRRLRKRFADVHTGFDETTGLAIRQALEDLGSFRLAEFNGVLLGEESPAAESWLLGFNTHSPPKGAAPSEQSALLTAMLRHRFGDRLIAFGSETLDQTSGDALLELFLHEALCPYLGHRQTRAVLEIFFADSNYARAKIQYEHRAGDVEAGNLEGSLTMALREIVWRELSGRPNPPLQVDTTRIDKLTASKVVEEARKNGVAILLGMPGVGKTLALRESGLPVFDVVRSRGISDFLKTNRGKMIVLDEFQGFGRDRQRFLAELRAEQTPVILVSLPAMEFMDVWRGVTTWDGSVPKVFRAGPMDEEHLRATMEYALRGYKDNSYQTEDWSSVFQLIGGSLRQAWEVLGVARSLGLRLTETRAERLYPIWKGEDEGKELKLYGHFIVHNFISFYSSCLNHLNSFRESFSLLQQIALEPVAWDQIKMEWTPHELEFIVRLLHYGVLNQDKNTGMIHIHGTLYRQFLRSINAEEFWRHGFGWLGPMIGGAISTWLALHATTSERSIVDLQAIFSTPFAIPAVPILVSMNLEWLTQSLKSYLPSSVRSFLNMNLRSA